MLRFLYDTTSAYSAQQILHWLWRTLRRHRTQVGINTLLGCLSVALDFSFIAATKHTIDIATHRTDGSLVAAGIMLTGIMLGLLCTSFATRWVRAILGVKAQNHMQRNLFDRLLHSDWQATGTRHSGDILNRLERDVRDVVSAVTETFPSFISVCVRLCGAFLFMYMMDTALACLTIVLLPLFLLLSKLYIKRMRSLTRDIRQTDSRIQSILQETVQHRMVIQTLQRQDEMVDKLDGVQQHLRRQIRHRTKFASLSSSTLTLGFMGCYLITFLWGAARLHEGTITYGMMIAFIQLIGQIQSPFRDMARFIPVLVGAFTAGERLMEIEEIPMEEDTERHELAAVPGIRMHGVSYRYSSESRLVLNRLDFDFPPGSRTAIIGETGAGKTTLVRLMLSLIRPAEGKIELYDGQRSIPCSPGTRACFVYVPQGNTLLSGTIRENLLLGNPKADEAAMRQALTEACADFVFGLPRGLDTECSEHGGGLSEGQAQRIAIARALLCKGGILLLDEATSALDNETEGKLWHNISQHFRDKTLIFVTHRTNVIDPDTRILQLKRHS